MQGSDDARDREGERKPPDQSAGLNFDKRRIIVIVEPASSVLAI